MAIFVDLDDDDNETVQDTPHASDQLQSTRSDTPAPKQEDTPSTPPSPLPHHEPLTYPSSLITSPESTPPSPATATASLTAKRDLTHLAAAYPVIFSIATQLDHNDLSHLAYTCKQMRENMLQYRKNLLAASLVCSTATTKTIQSVRRRVLCVRDFVVRCGTCEKPTCRNCVYKTGGLTEENRKRLACRLRRVCKQCQTAPGVTQQPPETNSNYKICLCPRKMHWQCPTCRSADAPLTTHKSFLTLLHLEKLQLIQDIHCTHFTPSSHPPNSHRVWVESCPSQIHSSMCQPNFLSTAPHYNTGSITCAMELYPGGWADQDISTGYIYRPEPSACIGATSDWWSTLISDPNQDGFITYPSYDPNTSTRFYYSLSMYSGLSGGDEGIIPCSNPLRPRWARLVGKGLDTRGVGVALWNLDQMHSMLEDEKAGKVRAWCTWCEGVVLSKADEKFLGVEFPV